MRHTDWLYYQKKQSKQKLTDRETGQIDLDAYLNNASKFFIDDEYVQLIPKKIILRQIHLEKFNPLIAVKFYFVLNELFHRDFEIYSFRHGYLKNEKINFPEVLFREDLESSLVEPSLPPKEQFFILDDQKITDLAELFDGFHSEIPIDFRPFGLGKLLQKDDSDDESDDESDDKDTKNIRDLIEQALESAPKLLQHKPASPGVRYLKELFWERIDESTTLEELDDYLHAYRIHELYIILSTDMTIEQFNIINKIIIKGHVQSFAIAGELSLLSQLQLNKRDEILSFMNLDSSLSMENRDFDLNALPRKMNKLFLSKVKISSRSFGEKQIESVELNQVGLEQNSLINILNQIPSIQSLKLSHLILQGYEYQILLNPLVHLKQIIIEVDKTSPTLSAPLERLIFQQSAILEHLELPINSSSLISFLPKLKVGKFKYCQSDSEFDLHQFLTQMPVIQELELVWDFEYFLKLKPSSLHLPHLKSIKISYLNSEQLKYLLEIAPNLEVLTINNLPSDARIPAGLQVEEINKYNYLKVQSHHPSTATPSIPQHRPEDMLDYAPESKPYEFKNINDSLNQGMVIDKLCRYLAIQKNISSETLDLLQKGICHSLANFLLYQGYENTRLFLQEAKNWNGELDSLSAEEIKNFETLYSMVDTTYIQKNHSATQNIFIGTNLEAMLGKENGLILNNPWHSIAIQKLDMQWIIYDPNHVFGPILFKSQEELLRNIQNSLGELVTISTLNSHLYNDAPVGIHDIPRFIESGGALILNILSPELLVCIITSIEEKNIPLRALCNGLKMKDNDGQPSWKILPKGFCELIIDTFADTDCPADFQELITTIQNYHRPKASEMLLPISFYKNIKAEFCNWQTGLNKDEQPIQQYLLNLMHEEKILIQTQNLTTLLSLRNGIQKTARSLSKPIYYAHTSEDLQLILKRLRPQKNGKIEIEVGTPLSDFLNENSDSTKIILINYDNFSTEDIIAFNEILNVEAQINGISLGSEIQIIGLQNIARQDAYQESDFYSRFAKVELFNLPESTLEDFEKVFEIEQASDTTAVGIQIFDSSSWKDILFGRFIIHGNDFKFIPGAITDCPLPETLLLENAPVTDVEFCEFWRQASISGRVSIHGFVYHIPEGFKLIHQSGYAWDDLKNCLTPVSVSPQYVLTPYNLTKFIGGQKIQNGQIVYQEGLIHSETTDSLSLLVTEELSHGQWAKLLSASLGIKTLEIYLLPKIVVPEAIQHLVKTYQQQHLEIIQSNDIEQYLEENPLPGLTIDVSGMEGIELLDYIKPIKVESQGFRFEYKPSWLLEELGQGHKVTLKGHFSERLIQAINEYTLLRPEFYKNLRLVGDHKSPLGKLNPRVIDYPTSKTLSASENASLELLISSNISLQMSDLDSDAFTRQRISGLTDALREAPCVFVTGLSGCGKTTFIKKYLNPFLEKEGISAWISSTQEPAYLFFDEANLGDNDWLMFEGLYQTPPYIFYEGEYHRLSPHHKVIFAGNPVSYGDERGLPKLWTTHPNVVLFHPLSVSALKEEVLNPLLNHTPLVAHAKDICEPILEIYQTIMTYAEDKILISPRELQTMVMLTLSDYQQEPHQNPREIARYYAYTIGRQLVPVIHLDKFDAQFHIERPLKSFANYDDFIMTQSRQKPCIYLRDILNLRAFRRRNAGLSEEQKTSGLSGLILEGEPGVGKSELLIKILTEEFHFQKASEKTGAKDNVFFMIPPSISIEERKALLLEAFHEGAVVIIDEMNSGPMLESFLNALLMGKTPTGEVARNPGFTLLSTQNPTCRGGRRAQSEALLRRMMKFTLSDYSQQELVEILKLKKIDEKTAMVLASIFLEQHQYAKQHGFTPEPSFRDLMRFTQQIKNHPEITHFFSRPFEFDEYHRHLKEILNLKLSSEDIIYLIKNIEIVRPIPNDEFLILNFLNKLSKTNADILKAYIENIDIQENILQKIKKKSIKKEVLSWWIDKQKPINEIIFKEIQKYPELKIKTLLILVNTNFNTQVRISSGEFLILLKECRRLQIKPSAITSSIEIIEKLSSTKISELIIDWNEEDKDLVEPFFNKISDMGFLEHIDITQLNCHPKIQEAIISWYITHQKTIQLIPDVLGLIFHSPALQEKILGISKEEFLIQQPSIDAEKLYTAIECNNWGADIALNYKEFLSVLYYKIITDTPEEIKNWLDTTKIDNQSNLPKDAHQTLKHIIHHFQRKGQTELIQEILIKFKNKINTLDNDIGLFDIFQNQFPEMLQEIDNIQNPLLFDRLNIANFNIRPLLKYVSENPRYINNLILQLDIVRLEQIKNEEIFITNTRFREQFLSQLNSKYYLGHSFLDAAKHYSKDSEKYLAIHTHLIKIHEQIYLYYKTENEFERHIDEISKLTSQFVKDYQNPMGIKEYILNIMLMIGAAVTLGLLLYFIPLYKQDNSLTQAAKDIEGRFKLK